MERRITNFVDLMAQECRATAFINSLADGTFLFNLPLNITVLDLKKMIQRKTRDEHMAKCRPEELVLSCGAEVLHNEDTLQMVKGECADLEDLFVSSPAPIGGGSKSAFKPFEPPLTSGRRINFFERFE
jgi:hypothetical protein